MALNVPGLVASIVNAIKPVLNQHWDEAQSFAQTEAIKMAHTLANIEELHLAGKIDDDQARALLQMQQHATQAVLLAIAGIGLIAAQNAINAALGAIRDMVNGALGFQLI